MSSQYKSLITFSWGFAQIRTRQIPGVLEPHWRFTSGTAIKVPKPHHFKMLQARIHDVRYHCPVTWSISRLSLFVNWFVHERATLHPCGKVRDFSAKRIGNVHVPSTKHRLSSNFTKSVIPIQWRHCPARCSLASIPFCELVRTVLRQNRHFDGAVVLNLSPLRKKN